MLRLSSLDVVKAAAQEIIDISAQHEAEHWVKAHKAEIPLCVYQAVLFLGILRGELSKTRQRASNILALFRIQLGVSPSSEKGSCRPQNPKLSDEEQLLALKARRAKLIKEIRNYEERLGKGRKKRQNRSDDALSPPKEIAEDRFLSSDETLFNGNIADKVTEDKPLRVGRVENFDNPRGLHSVTDDRTRYEHSVTTKTIRLSVETVTDPRTGKSVTASTDEIGPPNSQSTWVGIANTIISIIGYAIPINRLSKMLTASNPYFTSTQLCSQLKLAAELFAPIYTCLGEQLADSDVLYGDDTKVRVIEVNRALKDGGELGAAPEGSLISRLSESFGRVFKKKNGKGNKRSLNVSVVIGKTEAKDPRSYIFFFRSHLGSLGDLVTKILETRSPKRKKITLLSDLATTNLLSKDLYQRFEITHAGCAAHARRPFFKHKDKDQKLCYWMLSAFLVLEQIEDRIDELGRTRVRIERYRNRYSRKVWAIMRNRCESVLRGERIYGEYWPKTSEIYIACNYVVEHFKELTTYLDDPHLSSTNNLSERVLRWDKIMEDGSKFRMTEAGRVHIDILRTIVHSCSAARVEIKDYLLFVFKNRLEIETDPTNFTPFAYALKIDPAGK